METRITNRAIIWKAVFSLILDVTGILLNLALIFLMTTSASLSEFGAFSLLTAWITIIGTFSELGFPTAYIRLKNKYEHDGNPDISYAFLRTGTRWMLLAAISTSIVFVSAAYVLLQNTATDFLSIVSIATCLPALVLNASSQSWLQADNRPVYARVVSRLIRPIASVLAFICLSMSGVLTVLQTCCLSFLIGISLSAFVGSWNTPHFLSGSVSGKAFKAEWIRNMLPIFTSNAIFMTSQRLDLLFVGLFTSTADAALFAISTRFSELVTLGLTTTSSTIAPRLAFAYSSNSRTTLQTLVDITIALSLGIAIPSVVLFFFWGNVLLSTFGEEYSAGYTVLLVLLVSQAFNAATGPNGVLLNMIGAQSTLVRLQVITLLLNATLGPAFIIAYGIVGAAFATVITSIVLNLLIIVSLWRKVGVRCFPSYSTIVAVLGR